MPRAPSRLSCSEFISAPTPIFEFDRFATAAPVFALRVSRRYCRALILVTRVGGCVRGTRRCLDSRNCMPHRPTSSSTSEDDLPIYGHQILNGRRERCGLSRSALLPPAVSQFDLRPVPIHIDVYHP